MYLLKSNSKPAPSERKKKKVELLGSFQKYVEQSKKKQDTQIQEKPAGPNTGQPLPSQGILQFMAPAPNASIQGPAAGTGGQKGKDAKMNTK